MNGNSFDSLSDGTRSSPAGRSGPAEFQYETGADPLMTGYGALRETMTVNEIGLYGRLPRGGPASLG